MIDPQTFLPLTFGFVFMAMIVVIAVVASVKKSRSNTSGNRTASGNRTVTYRPAPPVKPAPSEEQRHAAHVADSHAHEHLGKEEHYGEIVGSLGDINDEGCADLNGVRFISHDVAYETQTLQNNDYADVKRAVVLGEILNSPRFKCPYGRRPHK